MNIEQARVELEAQKREIEALMGLTHAMVDRFHRVHQALARVQGSGISPERMPSTVMLANEIYRQQEGQRSRVHSLFQGIDKVISG